MEVQGFSQVLLSASGAEAGDTVFSGDDVAFGSCSFCNADLNLCKRLNSVFIYCSVCLCVWARVYHSALEEVGRRRVVAGSFLPPRGFHRSNSDRPVREGLNAPSHLPALGC